MKYFNFAAITILIILMALPAAAQRSRRESIKSADALLSSARIALLASPPRYDEAMDLCLEVLENNGPVPEAYIHIASIYREYAGKDYDLNDKLEHIQLMTLYFDSMATSCDNKDIKKKYRKKCDEFLEQIDSVRVYFWRDDYGSAVDLVERLDESYIPAVKNATDDTAKAEAESKLNAAADSTMLHFMIAYTVDPTEIKSLEGIGIVYDRLKKYDSSAYWFSKAYEIDPENIGIIQSIAYAYLQSRDWENSITWLKKMAEKAPDESEALSNIAVCFNNLKQYDSAHAYNMKAIIVDSTAGGALFDVGQYWLLASQDASDSLTFYQKENNNAEADKWMKNRDRRLDSSAVYFEKTLLVEPENVLAMEQFGIVTMVRGKFEEALEAFNKLIELESFRKDHWRNKGDVEIQLGKFCEAAKSFEKYVELDPNDVKVWETLSDLYKSCDQPEKAKEAAAKAEEIKNL